MKPKDKTELVREAWLPALEQQGHRQCRNVWADDNGGVCALELLREVAGLSWKQVDRKAVPRTRHQEKLHKANPNFWAPGSLDLCRADVIGEAAGLRSEIVCEILRLNEPTLTSWFRRVDIDAGTGTFAQIAQAVRDWLVRHAEHMRRYSHGAELAASYRARAMARH